MIQNYSRKVENGGGGRLKRTGGKNRAWAAIPESNFFKILAQTGLLVYNHAVNQIHPKR